MPWSEVEHKPNVLPLRDLPPDLSALPQENVIRQPRDDLR